MNTPSINEPADTPRRSIPRHAIVLLGLVIVVALGHGWALNDGLFLDDHWHQKSLREADWSFSDLTAATTLEPKRFVHLWWQDKDFQWQYGRPAAMAWMKLVQTFAGGSVELQHLSSILWHLACCCLVYTLCFKISRHLGWSAFAGLLFAIYPHSAYAVGWLASANAVIQTTLIVAALLCYAHASGLKLDRVAQGADVPALRRGVFALVVLLFVLALFSRENAFVFPLFAMAFDRAFGGRGHFRRRLPVHAVLLVMSVGFVVWRFSQMDAPIPYVYARRPDTAAYPAWLVAKLLHYVVCAIWLTPMVIGPTGRGNPFVEVPWDCALMIIILIAMGTGYYFACRRHVRGYWIWPMWIVLAVLPVVPVLATPHSAYMAGVGFALAVVMKAAHAPARSSKGSIAAATYLMIASIAAFAIYRVCWRGVVRAEQYTVARMTSQPRPPPDSHLFLINLPLANIYLPLSLQESWSMPAKELRCHVLTFAPHVLMGPSATRIRQVDANSFVVRIEEDPYFSGLLGRFLTGAMRGAGRLERGEVVKGDLFDVEIVAADERGVSELKYTFHEPLASENYRFYLITRDSPGDMILFGERPAEQISQVEPLPESGGRRAQEDEMWQAREGLFEVLDATARIIRTDLYLTGPPRPSP